MTSKPIFVVFDTETDGLAYECTKIHVLSWTTDGKDVQSTDNYKRMGDVFSLPNTLFVCHNVVRFDLVVLNRILGLNLDYKKFVDTLALSWYLFPNRSKHGLESWGETYGIEKPEVGDWHGLTYEEYANRCEEDVKINYKLWTDCKGKLERIYE